MVVQRLAPDRSAHRSSILLTLCLAALVINIDVTIVNVTLPSLVRQLDATTTELQWVVDAYNLVFAALILAAGSLSDRVGRKGMLLAGLGIFAAGTLAGSFASTPAQLIACRALMGVGEAAILPATLSIIANVFTDRAGRAKAIGLWGATTGVGIAAGPIIGGWLLEHFWWGSVFLFMAPVALVIAAVVARWCRRQRIRLPRESTGTASPCRPRGWGCSCSESSRHRTGGGVRRLRGGLGGGSRCYGGLRGRGAANRASDARRGSLQEARGSRPRAGRSRSVSSPWPASRSSSRSTSSSSRITGSWVPVCGSCRLPRR